MSIDERSVLLARVQAALVELRQAERSIEEEVIDSRLRERVGSRFDRLLSAHRGQLQTLLSEVKDGAPLDQCWVSYRDFSEQTTPLFRECLAFLHGGLIRQQGIDEGLCDIADHLLDLLSQRADVPWGRFTVLAEGEFFGEMAEIVRLRFPELTVWNLPVAAHEFGHFLGPKIEVVSLAGPRRPFVELLETERQLDDQAWFHLHEHFADVFACYALGPAFACTCLLLRFDPTQDRDSSRHPSPATRAYLILRTLERLDEDAGIQRPYRALTEFLSDAWQRSRLAATRPTELEGGLAAKLEERLEALLGLLVTNLPSRLRYARSEWLRAQRLADELMGDGNVRAIRADDTVLDVINGAWLARIGSWGDSAAEGAIDDTAKSWCASMVQRKQRAAARRQ